MKKLLVLAGVAALAGCSQSEEPTTEDPVAMDQLTATGAFVLEYADGSSSLLFSGEDGEQIYTDEMGLTGTWEVTEEGSCIDADGEGGEDGFCVTLGEVAEDGTFVVTYDNGWGPATVRPLTRDLTPGETPVVETGAYEGTREDGTKWLNALTPDGAIYRGDVAGTGSWEVVDGQRCGTPDDPEMQGGCASVADVSEDGNSWTAVPDEGEPFTVTRVL